MMKISFKNGFDIKSKRVALVESNPLFIVLGIYLLIHHHD